MNVTVVIATATLDNNLDISGEYIWRAYSNGEDTGLTGILTGNFEPIGDTPQIDFGGSVTVVGFPGGTTLSFKLETPVGTLLDGVTEEGGEPVTWEVPDVPNHVDTNLTQIFFDILEVDGCPDVYAENYDSTVTNNDGSCEYFDFTDKIKISEIHYTIDGQKQITAQDQNNDEATWEFFEIQNVSNETISTKGLSIAMFTNNATEYNRCGDNWRGGLPINSSLEPYGRMVFANNAEAYNGKCYCISADTEIWTTNESCDASACPEGDDYRTFEHLIAYDGSNDDVANLYEWQSGTGASRELSNTSENIVLRDANPSVQDTLAGSSANNNHRGNLVERVRYFAGTEDVLDDGINSCLDSWPSNVLSNVSSIVLINDELDNNCGSNWYRSGIEGGSPGLPNSLPWNSSTFRTFLGGTFLFTEFHIDPITGLEATHEFIEMYNSSNYPIDTTGFIDILSSGARPIEIDDQFQLGGMSRVIIQPGEFLLFMRQEGFDSGTVGSYLCENRYLYNGNLSNNGESISIRDIHGTLIDTFNTNPIMDDVSSWDASQPYAYGSIAGGGSTLELIFSDECLDDNSTIECWQSSLYIRGTPCEETIAPILGCTDSEACNYDYDANVDDGSCTYPLICCLDNFGTGLCDHPIVSNYLQEVPTTCNECPEGYIEYIGPGIPGNDVYGCMDNTNCAYDSSATVSVGCATGTFECSNGLLGCDCNDTCNGDAYLNECSVCIGGTTGIIDNTNGFGGVYGQDCNNDCTPDTCDDDNITGCAQIDECGSCVGGDTGHIVLYSSLNDGDVSHSNYPVTQTQLFTESGIPYYAYTALNQDCDGNCPNDDNYGIGIDSCLICGGSNIQDGGGPQTDCSGNCFGEGTDLGCGCNLPGPVTYYADIDGDGIGNADAEWSGCEEDLPGGYVLNSGDNNDYCDNNATTGDYYTGNDYGLDDCNLCHYLPYGGESDNFNYFSILNTSKDCGDGVDPDSGFCPGAATFNQPPGTQRADTNGDGIGNECFETLVWYTSDNTFNFGAIINHGCNFTNKCKGTDNVWGPGVSMIHQGDEIPLEGLTAKGCRDPYALDYEARHYFDCIGTALGSNYGCCTYEEDCAGVENGNAFIDDCGVCSGGTTGHTANSDMDCNGDCVVGTPNHDGEWGGTAFFDSCGICSGGNSGHEADSDLDCAGECFGNHVEDADGYENCCEESQVLTYYEDSDGDGLGNADVSRTYCFEFVPDGWVLNQLDDDDTFFCPSTCDDNGQNIGSGDNPCIVDCAGVCGGISFIDDCGNCVLTATPIDCAGTCEGELGYGADIDDCGNCFGGNTSTLVTGCFDLVDELGYTEALLLYQTGNESSIFNGVCPPNWAMDCQGVCEGSTIVDCAGVCGGSSVLDLCEVCYNPGNGESPPNECVGCMDPTACNYSPDYTVDNGVCLWLDCNGDCSCEVDNQNDSSCSTILDFCGQCGGDNDCEGCTDPTAINYDPTATQNYNLNCVYGDISIVPQSSTGLGLDYYLIKPVGNDNFGQNTNFNGDDYNPNFGGWKFQNSNEVVYTYQYRIDRKIKDEQTGPEPGFTVNQRVTQDVSTGEVIDDGASGEQPCTWFIDNPNTNPDTQNMAGMKTFETFINCGYGKTLDTDGIYYFDMAVTGSLGTKVRLQKDINVDGIFKIKQTLRTNNIEGNPSVDQVYIPEQAIHLAQYDEANFSLFQRYLNREYWWKENNLFDRLPLGCFFFDEENQHFVQDDISEWKLIGSTYNSLQKNFDIPFYKNYLDGYCVNIEHVGEGTAGTCLGGINNGSGCNCEAPGGDGMDAQDCTDHTACMSGIDDFSAGYFTPDVNSTTKRAQYQDVKSGERKATAHEYYSKETFPEYYKNTSAPSEFYFLFTPREGVAPGTTLDSNFIFGDRSRKDLDSDKYDYYIGIVDWGDETTREEQDFDFKYNPEKLEQGKIIKHTYTRPGIYEVSGYMFNVYKDEACRTRCYISQVDETDETSVPPWYNVFDNPTPNIFGVDQEYCDNAGGQFIINDENYCGVSNFIKFKYRINVSSNEDNEVFLPFDENNITIGGVSDNSIYYRTIQRELGYLETGGKLDLDFQYIQDKLNTEYAYAKMNEYSVESSATLNIFNQPILSGSVSFSGELQETGSINHPFPGPAPNPVTIVSGSYNKGYGELSKNNYFGNADINQVRFFNRGDYTMDKMLGFVNIAPDKSFQLIEGSGAVLITAPHSPRTLRPTALSYDPDGQYPAWDHAPDYYTGAMAYQVGKMTNSHVLIATHMQDDPNYYHYIGYDYFGRTGNTATPAFSGMEGQLHPFKKKLKEYLLEHPEIKLVIDFHGAGDYRPFAVDIGVAYPNKNRDPNGSYVKGYTDFGWYSNNTEGFNLYPLSEHDFNFDFPGPASPIKNRFWDGSLDSQWNTFSDMDTYAPSMVTDLGRGLTSPQNPNGDSLLLKLIEILNQNDIGDGEGYHDRRNSGLYEYADGLNIAYEYFAGEYLEQDSHSCPDRQDNQYNLAGYLNECDLGIYDDCTDAWELYLDGNYYCAEPGVKKPIVIGRDFTAGAQYTVTRFVTLDATVSDSFVDDGGDDGGGSNDPAGFIGNVDAFQFEMSRNHRTFELDEPRDLRMYKAMSEFIAYVNNHYGNESVIPNFDSDEFKSTYEKTYDFYHNFLKPQGEILLDDSIALSQHPDNPGSKRYWKNIIPSNYDITWRDGFIDYSIELNNILRRGGENELTIKPIDTILNSNQTFSICLPDESIGGIGLDGESDCELLYDDISFNKYSNNNSPLQITSTHDTTLSDNIVYWNLGNMMIGSEEFNTMFDGDNNVERITWIKNGKKRNSTYYDGSWSSDGESLNVLEQGRYYLFEMYVSVDLQRDELENNKILPTVLKHSKKIDIESNQEWLSRTTNVHRQLDDIEFINPPDSDSGFGEIIKVENVKPYYPVLPKFDLFGKFSSEENLQKSEIEVEVGTQKWDVEGNPIGEDPGTCGCNSAGLVDDYNCNYGYDAQCIFVSNGVFDCECLLIQGEVNEEGDSPGDDDLFGIDALIENNIPFGSPDRLWYEYDESSPALNDDYSSNLLNIYTQAIVDINFSEIDVDENRLPNNSGVELYNYVFGDYKVLFDEDTRIPSKGDFENLPQIRKDKGRAY